MFIPRSHYIDFSLDSRLWHAKYWKPTNSLGFRDSEPNNHYPAILFVGDSFTAGEGLKSVDERFSDIVGKELNKKRKQYNVINIGVPNLDTRSEYNVMKQFIYLTKIKPEKIILQYFGNDIDGVAMDNGMKYNFNLKEYANKFLVPALACSYSINFIYWSFPQRKFLTPYMDFIFQAYKNDKILSKHKDDLLLFVNYAKEHSIQLIVVIFPYLSNIEMSDAMYGDNIVNFFKANQIGVISVSPLIKDIPVPDRIININDGHPSKIINNIVAREILNKIRIN